MNIIFSSDDNYSPYLAISIFSILRSNINEKINFYILDLGIRNESKDIINRMVESYGSQAFFIMVSESDFSHFPRTIDYISFATYARLNLTNYIGNIDKAIYIDVDTLTNGSLRYLWNIDISDYYLAACQDTFIDIENLTYKHQIGLDKKVYFNAGVLLLNLKKWRNEDVFENSIKWLEKYKDLIKYQDQDILNGIFKDKVRIIDNRFNFTPSERNLIRNKHKRSTKMPVVIYHYCGPDKFWHANCDHAYSYMSYSFLQEVDKRFTIPKSWQACFEKISPCQKIKKIKKRISDRLKYNIY